MPEYLARCRHPYLPAISRCGYLAQRASEVSQSVGLSHDVWMKDRGLSALGLHVVTTLLKERALVCFVHSALPFGVAVSMADELVTARNAGGDQFGAVIVKCRIDQGGGRHAQTVKQLKAAPRANAITIFAPTVIEHIGCGLMGPIAAPSPSPNAKCAPG